MRQSFAERRAESKFVVDGMLGGLARWLRILGYVTEYDSKANDSELLKISQASDAILLTRDEELHKRALAKNLHSIMVLGERDEIRLAQLVSSLGISLDIDMAATRCPECGSPLVEVSREDASKTVPAKSLNLYDRFWRCVNLQCAKMYWVGSHWKQMRQTLDGARRISSEKTVKP